MRILSLTKQSGAENKFFCAVFFISFAEMPTYLLTSADENTLISSIAKYWSGGLPFTILYNGKG